MGQISKRVGVFLSCYNGKQFWKGFVVEPLLGLQSQVATNFIRTNDHTLHSFQKTQTTKASNESSQC